MPQLRPFVFIKGYHHFKWRANIWPNWCSKTRVIIFYFPSSFSTHHPLHLSCYHWHYLPRFMSHPMPWFSWTGQIHVRVSILITLFDCHLQFLLFKRFFWSHVVRICGEVSKDDPFTRGYFGGHVDAHSDTCRLHGSGNPGHAIHLLPIPVPSILFKKESIHKTSF